MLLPLFKTCYIYLAPGRARHACVRRGLRSKAPMVSEVAMPEGAGLAALGKALGESRLPVRLMLSGHLAHVLALPWQDTLETAEEWEAYARHVCTAVFGERENGWRIRLTRQAYGQPVIAAAVEERRYAGIEADLRAQGRRLLSVEPYCAAVFDRHRGALGRDFWLFVAEAGTCVCLYARNGAICSVLAHPLETDWRGSLAAFIGRELAKRGDDGAVPVFLHAAGAPVRFTEAELPGIRVVVLAAGWGDGLGGLP